MSQTVEKLSKSIIYLLLIFLISMNILFSLSIHYDWFEEKVSTRPDDVLPTDYFDIVDPWGKTTFVDQPNSKGIDLSVCNTFTYENVLGSSKKPNINRVITDFEDGFSHLSENPICIDEDQIVCRKAKHVCDGSGIADCIGKTGDIFKRGTTEIYNSACTNIPACKSTIGSLSFNFSLGGRTISPIESSTRFMTFEKIFVSALTFTNLDNDLTTDFYTGEGRLFTVNTDLIPELGDSETFYPLIKYEGKVNSNFKQNIKIKRFIYKGGYVESEDGPYAEIHFRPNNLWVDALENDTSGQIGDVFIDQDPVEFWEGIQDNYRLQDKIRRIYREDGTETDNFCTAFIVSGKPSFSIYKRGKDSFVQNERLLVEGDEGQKDFYINVQKTTDFTIFLTLKKGGNPRKWLLIPPQDIGGGKVLPVVDRTSKMSVLCAPIDKNLIEYAQIRPADIRRFEPAFGDSVHNSSPSTSDELVKGLWSKVEIDDKIVKPNLIVKPGEEFLYRDFGGQEDIESTDLPLNVEGTLIWYSRPLREKKLFYGRSHPFHTTRGIDFKMQNGAYGGNTIDGLIYPLNTFEPYLRSIGDKEGELGEQNSPFFVIEPYRGSQEKIIGNLDIGIKISSSTLSFFSVKTNPDSYKPGNRYLDGEVIWEVKDPLQEINVFSPKYFLDSSNSGKPVTNFKPTGSIYSGRYLKSEKGVLVNIIMSGDMSDYDLFPPYSFFLTDQSVSGSGGGGLVDMYIKKGRVVSLTIKNGGTGYTAGRPVSITVPWQNVVDAVSVEIESGLPDISVDNLISDAVNTQYTYRAIPQREDGTTIFSIDQDNTSEVSSNNFMIKSTSINIDNNSIVLSGSDYSGMIGDGGSGYKVGDIIYIDQIDSEGNTTIKGSRSEEDFFSVRVENVSDQVVNIKTPNLIKPNTSTDLPFYQSDYYVYNFYKIGETIYRKSPQQIGYINDENITDWITTGDGDQIKNYIFRNSPGGITSTVGLYTLQFTRLNYSNDGNNRISPRENLEIGKFIPYTEYQTESREEGWRDFFNIKNYNSVQFIPNSISDIYTTKFNITDLPTF